MKTILFVLRLALTLLAITAVVAVALAGVNMITAPAIAELPLTLECKVIYSVRQDGSVMPEDVLQRYYPDWENNKNDVHSVYYGEIVAAYITE